MADSPKKLFKALDKGTQKTTTPIKKKLPAAPAVSSPGNIESPKAETTTPKVPKVGPSSFPSKLPFHGGVND